VWSGVMDPVSPCDPSTNYLQLCFLALFPIFFSRVGMLCRLPWLSAGPRAWFCMGNPNGHSPCESSPAPSRFPRPGAADCPAPGDTQPVTSRAAESDCRSIRLRCKVKARSLWQRRDAKLSFLLSSQCVLGTASGPVVLQTGI